MKTKTRKPWKGTEDKELYNVLKENRVDSFEVISKNLAVTGKKIKKRTHIAIAGRIYSMKLNEKFPRINHEQASNPALTKAEIAFLKSILEKLTKK